MSSETDTPTGNAPETYGPTEHPPIPEGGGTRRMLVSNVWGGVPVGVSSEHGYNVQSWNPDCSWYQYGREYGLDGCQHPGMDISLAFGTELVAAEGGTVEYAGPDRYYEPNHVNIRTAAGEVHIYGHMSEVDGSLWVGAQVDAGQRLGRSGSSNGPHLHFERRVPGNCRSGFCALDPESTLVNAGAAPFNNVEEPVRQFSAGDRIRVVDPPLRFRSAAGLDSDIIEELEENVELTVIGGPEQAGGYDWYQVTRVDDQREGWLAGQFCGLVTE